LPGLIVATSPARGPFASRTAARGAVWDGSDDRFTQTTWGADAEYSRDYYLVRLEAIVSDWNLPLVHAPMPQMPLRAVSTLVEGRYKIRPGLYAVARVDHLGFSDISGATRTATSDASVTRLEAGSASSLRRKLG